MRKFWCCVGIALDLSCSILFCHQVFVLWNLTNDCGKLLIDVGILSGSMFLLLLRLMLFHAFQRGIQIGDIVFDDNRRGKIVTIYLGFSRVHMEDGTTTAIWNLESLLVTPEGKETREHRLQIWPFIGHTLMTWIDGFCLVMALLPPATLILIDLTLLTTYWNAALSMIVLLTLSLCAQIGLLQKFQSKQPLKFASYGSTDQGQLYSGVFLTITSNQEEDHIKIRPNATGQVYLSEECQFGPYL